MRIKLLKRGCSDKVAKTEDEDVGVSSSNLKFKFEHDALDLDDVGLGRDLVNSPMLAELGVVEVQDILKDGGPVKEQSQDIDFKLDVSGGPRKRLRRGSLGLPSLFLLSIMETTQIETSSFYTGGLWPPLEFCDLQLKGQPQCSPSVAIRSVGSSVRVVATPESLPQRARINETPHLSDRNTNRGWVSIVKNPGGSLSHSKHCPLINPVNSSE